MIWSQNSRYTALFWVYCCLLTWWVSDHIFFWDTVQLASKHAHWYYEHNFQRFLLPENIDSGHPPIFGLYLAICWKTFGKSLIVSHFSMLPFLIGITWFLQKIGTYYGNTKTAKYLTLLVLVDPLFAGQSILVSPDIVLVFAFLGGIYAILVEYKIGLILSTILLGTISMRGMMATFGLYLWWVITTTISVEKESSFLKSLIPIAFNKIRYFLPAGLIAISFLGYHYYATGWIGYHPNSPWAGSFEQVGISGFIKNIGLLGWRFLDFGRVFLIGCLFWLLLKTIGLKKLGTSSKESLLKIKSLLVLIIVLALLLTPSLLLHKGLMSHRYLLPITLSITLFFYHLCVAFVVQKKIRQLFIGLTFLGLLTGNLWIYPKQVAQGWDATLAHLPYYDLRNQMVDYIHEKGIPVSEVGTVFPNIGPLEAYDLKGQTDGFVKKDFSKNKYFFYSVVYNDVSDGELQELENNWIILKEFNAFRISVILYKKNK